MHISEIANGRVHLWAHLDQVESSALDQLKNVAALPWVFHHVAVMPDVHYGKGATVGSVIATKNAIAPAAVGVDIGCGMTAARTSLVASGLPDSLKAIRDAIEGNVPVGNGPGGAHQGLRSLGSDAKSHLDQFNTLRASDMATREATAWKQMGTLGGGNHFIELSLDESGRVWVVLHSGSRNVGKELAERHIKAAKALAHNQELPDRDLAVFLACTPEMAAYRHDLMWAQEYARLNRQCMIGWVFRALRGFFPDLSIEETISCHHNYVAEETHFGEQVLVTRKGAIRARRGDLGIIPGSMGTATYIVEGLGNPDSFESASHGAGRAMSRGAAKRAFTEADLAEQTRGVECRKDTGVLDEIPGAYKDIDQVMANQGDLVRIRNRLKQVMCVKG